MSQTNFIDLKIKQDWELLVSHIYNNTECCGWEDDDNDLEGQDYLKHITWYGDLCIEIYEENVTIYDTHGFNHHSVTPFDLDALKITPRIPYTEIYFSENNYIDKFMEVFNVYRNSFYEELKKLNIPIVNFTSLISGFGVKGSA